MERERDDENETFKMYFTVVNGLFNDPFSKEVNSHQKFHRFKNCLNAQY